MTTAAASAGTEFRPATCQERLQYGSLATNCPRVAPMPLRVSNDREGVAGTIPPGAVTVPPAQYPFTSTMTSMGLADEFHRSTFPAPDIREATREVPAWFATKLTLDMSGLVVP